MEEKKLICNLWGKNVSFTVDYGCYFGEHIQPNQEKSYNEFLNKFLKVDNKNGNLLDGDEINKAKKEILKYLEIEYGVKEEGDNLMKFITPTKISIIDNVDENQIFLKFENVFDDEHGLAIEFINNKFTRVGDFDIALL